MHMLQDLKKRKERCSSETHKVEPSPKNSLSTDLLNGSNMHELKELKLIISDDKTTLSTQLLLSAGMK